MQSKTVQSKCPVEGKKKSLGSFGEGFVFLDEV